VRLPGKTMRCSKLRLGEPSREEVTGLKYRQDIDVGTFSPPANQSSSAPRGERRGVGAREVTCTEVARRDGDRVVPVCAPVDFGSPACPCPPLRHATAKPSCISQA
jgi:hypothetical protein